MVLFHTVNDPGEFEFHKIKVGFPGNIEILPFFAKNKGVPVLNAFDGSFYRINDSGEFEFYKIKVGFPGNIGFFAFFVKIKGVPVLKHIPRVSPSLNTFKQTRRRVREV